MSDFAPPTPSAAAGPVGKVRSPLAVILLGIITLGIYSLYWYYATFKELKNHTGEGIGGGIALLIAIVVSPVLLFLLPMEIGNMYARSGQDKPVSGVTGFWIFLPIVGAIVWIFKCQGALNARWSGGH